jgi:predicted Co/Zn/Cd cation transporter (cation efflux family)
MNKDYEKRGIFVSMIGSLLLSISAIIMAIIAESQAILLDGLYTFITLLMSLVSLKIINLVNLPETKHRPFGYVALEPFLNLIKSLIILILLIASMVTNIQTILTGGRNLVLDIAAVYTLISLVIYFIIMYSINKYAKKTHSSILALEVKNWYIDTLITIGIAISLGLVLIIYKMGFTAILPYIDPALVIGIVIVAFPTPVKSLIIELKNLLLISPENYIEHEVKRHIKPLIKRYNLINMGIYAIKTGRVYQLFLYTDIEGDSITIEYLDKIRLDIRKEISKLYNKHYTDVIFSKIDADTPNEI